MSFKEWTAVVQLAGQAVVTVWLVYDATHLAAVYWTIPSVATKLLWVIGFMVLFNIAGLILVSIGVAIARREEFKDERPDERDQTVFNKSNRNAYHTVSAGGLVTIVFLATGQDPVLGLYVLFAILMLGGVGRRLAAFLLSVQLADG
jgi:hypothetical protein